MALPQLAHTLASRSTFEGEQPVALAVPTTRSREHLHSPHSLSLSPASTGSMLPQFAFILWLQELPTQPQLGPLEDER